MFSESLVLYRTVRLATVVVVALAIAALLAGCDDNGTGGGGGTGEVYYDETGSSTDYETETVIVDACGTEADPSQTRERKVNVTVSGNVGVAVQILRANLGAQYSRGESASITLPSVPGARTEYTIEWTKESFFGDISVDGQTGQAQYEVRVETPSRTSAIDHDCIAGEYRLVRWEEASSPYTIYMEVDNGRLSIEDAGDATWTLAIRDAGEYPSPQPAISCKGRYYNNSQTLEGGPGGNAADWTSEMTGFAHDLWMAFCGWDVGGYSDPYALNLRVTGGGDQLEMTNSAGALIWERLN